MQLVRMLVLGGLLCAMLRAADPVVGTWVLDTKRSTFEPGPAPRSQTRVYRESEHGIIATVVTVGADGRTATVEYPVNNDGHPHAVTGSTEVDAIEMKQVNPRRAESSLLHAGRVIAKTVREVEGDKLTIRTEGLQPNGTPTRNVSVYTRK